MKKFLHFTLLFLFIPLTFAQTKEEITSALNDICKKIGYQGPNSFDQNNYAELAYLKRTYNLSYLSINDSVYKSTLNDHYYKKLYPYSKLLNDDVEITEDCLSDEVNESLNKANKLLFYIINPKYIKLPANIIDQLEEYATVDEFFGPFMMMQDIYFLKKYHSNDLSKTQKVKLATLETFFSKLLYTKYIENKPWAFHKFLSLKVLKMNDCELVKITDINDLVKYFNANGPLELGDEDKKDTILLNTLGYKKAMQYEFNAVLWIFLLELKKK